MNIQTISTKELRQNFSKVVAQVTAGNSLLLLYRSKPLAQIKPIAKPKTRSFSSSQLRRWITDDQLTDKQNQQIDAIIKRLP